MPQLIIKEASSALEAVGMIVGGCFYFFSKHPKKTWPIALICLLMFGWVATDILTSDKVKIDNIKPLAKIAGAPISSLSLFPQAFAGETFQRRDSIVLDGNFYGYRDTTYRIFKFKNEDALLIYDKTVGDADKVGYPFSKRRGLYMEQQKK